MPSGILVIIETSAGQVRESSLELIATAKGVSDDGDAGTVTALVVGSGVADVARDVAGREVDRAVYIDDPALERYTPDAWTQAIEAGIQQIDPTVVLFAGTTSGRDLGPYIAARAGTTCLSDCVGLKLEGDTGALIGTRPVYQGKMLTEVRVDSNGRAFVVMRAGTAAAPESSGSGDAERLDVQIDQNKLRVTLAEVKPKPAGGANLEQAEVVVVGGRGVGSQENFQLIEDLAAALDAPVGATRAVTDLGWRPHYEQIGQTGKNVRPKLYIGVGVSGAVQHTVGMQGSETIVTINRDADSPLFKMADIGVVGDLNEVVPALTREIAAARDK